MTEFVTMVGELSGLLWNNQLRPAFVRLGCEHCLGDSEFWDTPAYSGSPRRGASRVRVVFLIPGCLTASQINEMRRKA